ncbi:MAG: lysine--tRNA ligase [Vigna little leaf phytoplasma]|nr:lysine--tRNA ligase [Vigna little leaf phytoplasma]
MEKTSEQEQIRKNKIDYLKKLNIEPFYNDFFPRNNVVDILSQYLLYSRDDLIKNQINVSVAGRIILKRLQGKAGFFKLQDFNHNIQIYINKKLVNDKAFQIYKIADLGDIVGVKGYLFRTKTNELTIKALDFLHLSKNLIPLPDKYKGLKNKEVIRKKRYLDLIINVETRNVFVKRTNIIKAIRSFFDHKGFLEVETPILHSIYGGASARPFMTHHNALDSDFYLRIATEIPLKKLIIGGMKAIYEIGRVFRNEGIDANHNPEFTTIEAYLAYSNIEGMMNLTESCLKEVCQKILGTLEFEYQKQIINFNQFKKYRMLDIIKKKIGIDFSQELSLIECFRLAKEYNVPLQNFYTKGDIIAAFFETFVEKTLIQPTFIYDYPIEISPLARKNKTNPTLTERFELFVVGKELVNAFSELNDPIEQKSRFEQQLRQNSLGNDEAEEELDEDFIEAMAYGMPPTGGMGMGIDRLVMLLTNTPNIRDVILFPHFKNSKK